VTVLRRAARAADRAIQSDRAWHLLGSVGLTTALAALLICGTLAGAS
jgi:hypothetical protein